ncbi:DUF2786 domain-containing protein [Methanobrevibacter sp.]|uniref:DUF2786 domain-containing protein n=1 Tax=Methanobrevibacter sp. TaxID=66852 RepID=UPI0038669400
MNEKIISKINKLMALTSSSNEHESAKAAEMAFKLMEENHISMSDLNAAQIQEDLGEIGATTLNAVTKLTIWEKQLGAVIANHFDSISFNRRRPHPTHYGWWVYSMGFIGHESNRITCEIMYEWLRKLIQREANKTFPDYARRQSFCIGAVNSLVEKYYEEKKEDKNETGLVVYDEVRKWADDNMNMKTKKSRVPSVYSSALQAGASMGNNLSLNKQFGLKAIGC